MAESPQTRLTPCLLWDSSLMDTRGQYAECRVPACRKLGSKARGLCNGCYARLWRTGRLHEYPTVSWGQQNTYASMHGWIFSQLGSATTHSCIACAGAAHEWAYDGLDPRQEYGSNGKGKAWSFYSRKLEHYDPMCRSCHRSMDRAATTAELNEYRRWKHLTGKTLAEAGS